MSFYRQFRFVFIGILIFLLLWMSRTYAQTRECTLTAPEGTICIGHVSQLSPTQFALGMIAVEKKAKKLRSKNPAEYIEYLFQRPVPVAIGNGKFNMLDHHHLSRAIRMNGNDDVIVKVQYQWGHLTAIEFEARMLEMRFYYLKDENGNPRPVSALPRSVDQMKNDPYRTLAGEVEDKGGFIKRDTDFYIEFAWADFFRSHFTPTQIEGDLKRTVIAAVALAKSPAAAHLPGYIKP